MAESITINPKITFNGKEAVTAIIDPAFSAPDFKRVHGTIHTNIKAKEQIAFVRRFDKVTIKEPAGCGNGKQSKVIPMYEKFWEPHHTKIWLEMCWKDFLSTLYAWGIKNGIDRADLSDTDVASLLMDIMPPAIRDDLWRMLWFGDVDITDISDSPEGTLARSSDIKYYDLLDGYWKQIFAGVAEGSGFLHIPRYTITYNAQATYAAQLALPEGYSKTVWRALYYNADSRLRHNPNAVILCTESLMDNWREYKESKLLESSFKKEDGLLMDGVYWNVPIIQVPIWDRIIRSDFDNGSSYHLPHRAILVDPEHIATGFDSEDAVNKLESWYNKDTEYFNVKGGYTLDAKIIENFQFSAAY